MNTTVIRAHETLRLRASTSIPGLLLASLLTILSACDSPKVAEGLTRVFPTSEHPVERFTGCAFASPLLYEGADGASVIVTETAGTITAIDPDTGARQWQVVLPAPEGEDPFALATPVIVGDRLFVGYHTALTPSGMVSGPNRHGVSDPRVRQRVAAVDLATGTMDDAFPPVDLEAELPGNDDGTVPFLPNNALLRSTLLHGVPPGSTLGRIYLTFGNARDIQPWHGWAFEVDLDAWQASGAGAAMVGTMVTTPEPDCGPPGLSGSRERICGGGLWSPSGSLLVEEDEGYHIIMASGNGQLDLERQDYANSLLKVRPGLEFDPECDAELCADFNSDDPALACIESCKNLFVPRLLPGQEMPMPANGSCEGMTFFQCWGRLDYIGGSTPVRVDTPGGPPVLAYPTKDGHVYLVDAEHLGTMYDRDEVVALCGAEGDECLADWAGMMVTQPAVQEIDGTPVVVFPAFVPDRTHPAGVVAFNLVMRDGKPQLERRWEFPSFDTPEALTRFRWHPSRMTITDEPGVGPVGWVVEPAHDGLPGRLWGIKLDDGTEFAAADLDSKGIRFVLPLVHEDVIYVPSCDDNLGPSQLEAYRIAR